jgi:hypothetical protein
MARIIIIQPGEKVTRCYACGMYIIYNPLTDLRMTGGFDNFTPIRRTIECPNCHCDINIDRGIF